MKGEKAVITIDEDGNVSVDINGVHGSGCHALQEAISKALGGEVTKEITKAEFYKTATKKVVVTR